MLILAPEWRSGRKSESKREKLLVCFHLFHPMPPRSRKIRGVCNLCGKVRTNESMVGWTLNSTSVCACVWCPLNRLLSKHTWTVAVVACCCYCRCGCGSLVQNSKSFNKLFPAALVSSKIHHKTHTPARARQMFLCILTAAQWRVPCVCINEQTQKKNENEKRSTSIRFVAISFLLSDFVFFWSLLACCGWTTGVYSTQVARPDMLSFYCWREHDTKDNAQPTKCNNAFARSIFPPFSFRLAFVWQSSNKSHIKSQLADDIDSIYFYFHCYGCCCARHYRELNRCEQKYRNKRNEKFRREIQIQPEKFKDEATNAFFSFQRALPMQDLYLRRITPRSVPHPLAMYGKVVPLSKAIAFACLFVAAHHHHSSATTTPMTSDWNEDRTAQ